MYENYFPQSIPITEAIELQKGFAKQVVLEDRLPVVIKTIGGVSFYSRGTHINASICVLEADENFHTFKKLSEDVFSEKAVFPAIPAFEGFREGKIIAEAFEKLGVPEVILVEGYGINHPRKFGLASHIGLALETSTIGVSKEILGGKTEHKDGKEVLMQENEIVGQIIRHTLNSPKFYVSPGHNITLGSAVKITKKSMKSNVPEPLKIARENLLKKLQSHL